MYFYVIKYFQKKLFWIIIVLFSYLSVFAQEQNNDIIKSLDKIIEFTEFVYGSDDILLNGQHYTLKNKDAKGHPFFGDGKWSKETLIVKGKVFVDVELIYDVEADKLILNAKYNENTFIKIELSDEVIDSFNIQSHHFINSRQFLSDPGELIYFEQIYNGDFFFLIKHKKILNNAYYDTPPFGRFSDMQSVYYIYEDGKMKRLISKRSFLEYFKENKKEIRKYMRKNKIRYKKASLEELRALVKYCDVIN